MTVAVVAMYAVAAAAAAVDAVVALVVVVGVTALRRRRRGSESQSRWRGLCMQAGHRMWAAVVVMVVEIGVAV